MHALPWGLSFILWGFLKITSDFSSKLEKAGCVLGVFIACLPFENTFGIRIFRRESRIPGDTLGEEWAQY